MPEGQPAGATPAGEGATPATTPDEQGKAPKGDEPLGQPGLAALTKERDARAAAEKARDELAAKVKEFEDKDKSESERQASRITDLETQLAAAQAAHRAATLEVATTSAARKVGFRDPDLAARLIASDVEFTDSGEPKNLEKLLEALAKTHPYLVNGKAAGDTGLGPRGAPAPTGNDDMNTLIRRAAGRA